MASAKTSSSLEAPHLRDYSELEGSLLPTALMVVATAGDSLPSFPMAPVGKCTSTEGPVKYAPVLSYEEEDRFNTTTTTIRPHQHTYLQPKVISCAPATALVFPVDPKNDNDDDDNLLAAELLRVGEERGRLLNEMEQEKIRRNTREIRAIRYHEKQAIRQANERARQLQGNEMPALSKPRLPWSTIMITTLLIIRRRKQRNDDTTSTYATTTNAEPQQPEYQRTYDRDYEISEYERRD